MTRLLRKHAKRLGLPPGTLIPTEEQPATKIKLSIIEYDENNFVEKEDVSIQEALEHIKSPSMTWIQVYGVTNPSIVESIGKRFNVHPLALEDILNTGQRSKLDLYGNQVFIITRFLFYNNHVKELRDEQVSLVFGSNYLISFLERDEDIFHPVKERLRQGNNRIRQQGGDYLAYAILDMIVDHYFVVLEKMDIYLDKLEEDISSSPARSTLLKIQRAKREMIFLRKSIWPMRDVINRFLHLDPPIVSPITQVYLGDVYDHVIQTIDVTEGFRDVVSGLFDIYLSNINIRTNDIMKFLTIVSTIFVPLTFISSVYGMNFEHMPEIHHPLGYYFVIAFMALVAIGMLLFFRHKKWIE